MKKLHKQDEKPVGNLQKLLHCASSLRCCLVLLHACTGLPHQIPEAASPQPEPDSLAAANKGLPLPPQPPPGLSGQQSLGSALHASGMCRPCGWFWKPQGCANGSECLRCHACPPGEIERRKRDKGARLEHAVVHFALEAWGFKLSTSTDPGHVHPWSRMGLARIGVSE